MSMPVTTTFTIEGYRIKEYKGVARGIIVRSPTIAQGIMGGLKNIIAAISAHIRRCASRPGSRRMICCCSMHVKWVRMRLSGCATMPLRLAFRAQVPKSFVTVPR